MKRRFAVPTVALVVGLTAGCRADAPVGPPTPVRSEAITFVPQAELADSRVTEEGRIVVGERTVGYQAHAAVRLILGDLKDPDFQQQAEALGSLAGVVMMGIPTESQLEQIEGAVRERLTTPQELRVAGIAIMVAGRMKTPGLMEIVRRIANDRDAAAAMLHAADARSIDAVQDAARRALESSSGNGSDRASSIIMVLRMIL